MSQEAYPNIKILTSIKQQLLPCLPKLMSLTCSQHNLCNSLFCGTFIKLGLGGGGEGGGGVGCGRTTNNELALAL